MYRLSMIAASAIIAIAPVAAVAETPRDLLTAAAFRAANKPMALALVS